MNIIFKIIYFFNTILKVTNLKKIVKILKALSDEGRLRILALLEKRNYLCVSEITKVIGLSQSTVSSHLKKLYDAEFIVCTKDGLWINYRLNENMGIEIRQFLISILHVINKDERIRLDVQL